MKVLPGMNLREILVASSGNLGKINGCYRSWSGYPFAGGLGRLSMFGIRWQTMCAGFSIAILGASVAFQVPILAAKDKAQSSTSATDKAAKKNKKVEKRTSKKSSDTSPSADDSSGPVTTGSGGVVSGTGFGLGTGNQAGSATQSTTTSTPPAAQYQATPPSKNTTSSAKRTTGTSKSRSTKGVPLNANHPLVKKVIDVQNRNQSTLLRQKGIAGMATGLDSDNNVVIRVYTTGADSPAIPTQIEGVSVVEVLTGPIRFAQGTGITTRLPPPTPSPIGVSTYINTQGQVNVACQGGTGTIGCRMIDSNKVVYALSCNHVFAGNQLIISSFNTATQTASDQTVTFFPIGTQALQPAGSDVGCVLPITKFSNILGTLSSAIVPFYAQYPDPCTGNPVLPNAGSTNTVDAAMVVTSTAALDSATPTGGYGIPTDSYVQASLGLAVQKYGRTTHLTTGTVTGLNATYNIQVDLSNFNNIQIKSICTETIAANGQTITTYQSGFPGSVTVAFTQQIEVSPSGTSAAFAQDGDSGALVVDLNNNPVALLQATSLSPIGLCGDFNAVKVQLVKAIGLATGAQVALHVDSRPSALEQSFDEKIGAGTPTPLTP
jgi:hypothetical protein